MKKYDVIIFDLDSTLVNIEGLDWLSENTGKGDQVKSLTKRSMEGEISVEKAMQEKMQLIAPSREDMIGLGRKYTRSLVEDAENVINTLHKLNKEVWILTGNYRPAVNIVAKSLGIPEDRVIANDIYFDQEGNYLGFATDNPLSKNGGKAEMIKRTFRKNSLRNIPVNYFMKRRTALIGDAVSDLETKECVDLFIGYGGVAVRNLVKEKADVYFEDESLLPLLPITLSEKEMLMVSKVLVSVPSRVSTIDQADDIDS